MMKIMKKGLLMLGAAAMVLASCTQNEVVEVAESRAIGFDAFVGNTTKADITSSSIDKFWVFADYENTPKWEDVFTNVQVNKPTATGNWTPEKDAYWVNGKTYIFMGYSDGGNKFADAEFDPATKTLKLPGYTVGDNDLIAGLTENVTGKASDNDPVSMTFSHVLSKVKFTFKTTASADLAVKVTGITFTAVNKADYEYSGSAMKWTENTATGAYSFGDITEIEKASAAGKSSAEKYVIPQNNASLEVNFTAVVGEEGNPLYGTYNLKGSLKYTDTSAGAINDMWTPGYVYNYTATIDPQLLDPTKYNKIEFTVDASNGVEAWKPADDTTVTPQKQQ